MHISKLWYLWLHSIISLSLLFCKMLILVYMCYKFLYLKRRTSPMQVMESLMLGTVHRTLKLELRLIEKD